MPSKRGREETGGGTSHPTTPPRRQALQDDATRGYAISVLASADMLSPPPKGTKLQAGRERALTSDELDTEWKGVYNDLVFKLKTAGAAIEALQQLLKIEKEEAEAREEELERRIGEL